MRRIFIYIFLFISSGLAAQDDSTFSKELSEVIVTATRTERKLGNVTVPVQLISSKSIQQSGSVRLNDILAEQTGLYITSGGATTSAGGGVFGNGIQIQGLSPDYTLILLDGEPIIGRQGGVIDLSRITVNNIRKVEIVKGPSSSLYGSEAMGGVVNIITEQPRGSHADASFRYGRFNSMDASLTGAIRKQKWGLQLFGNRNSSDGYDLDKSSAENTVDPYKSYTGQLRFNFNPGPLTRISLSGRYYDEVQDNNFPTQDLSNGNTIYITGSGQIRDMNVNPTITHKFSNKIQSVLRFYFSRYQYEQNLRKEADKSLYYYDFFQQDFYRIENQTDIQLPAHNYLSVGGGLVRENLNTTRYAGKRDNNIRYAFVQNEWTPSDKWVLVGGLRFDDNSAYQSRLSPKIALRYRASEKLGFTASYGAGFKAPDFRQLFLNFLNTAAGGYVVYGANEITLAELQKQQQEGVISEILPVAGKLALLKPEVSRGINAGAHYDVNEKLSFSINLFRNDIQNLIQTIIVAYRSNGAPVYSYFNVKEAFTEGGELNVSWRPGPKWKVQAGYQYLITADKADLRRIKEGTVYSRDIQTNASYKVSRREYAGLPNRSAHMANAKIFYDDPAGRWFGSFRALYRSRWGTYDKDGNDIINRSDEFAKGFILLNISAGKKLTDAWRLQAGIDNLLNYKDVLNQPGQPGIQPYISISYSINKTKKS